MLRIFAAVCHLSRSVTIGILIAHFFCHPLAAQSPYEIRIEPGRAFHAFGLSDGVSPPTGGFDAQLIEEPSGVSYGKVLLPYPPSASSLWDYNTGHSAPFVYDYGAGYASTPTWTEPNPTVHFIAANNTDLLLLEQDGVFTQLAYQRDAVTSTGVPRYEYAAPYNPAQPFRVHNLTTSSMTSWGEKNLAVASWQDASLSPTVTPVYLYLEEGFKGQAFTVAFRNPAFGTGDVQVQSAVAELGTTAVNVTQPNGQPLVLAANTYSKLSVAGGAGMEFWVQRQSDYAQEGGVVATKRPVVSGTNHHSLFGGFPPVTLHAITVYLRQSLANTTVRIQQPGGIFPLVPTGVSGTIQDYTLEGTDNSFHFHEYKAQILGPYGWGFTPYWLIDNNENVLNPNPNDPYAYDGWIWIGGEIEYSYPQAPPTNFQVHIPASRWNSRSFRLVSPTGIERATFVGLPAGDHIYFDPWHVDYFTHPNSQLSAGVVISPFEYEPGTWTIRDKQTGESRPVSSDNRNWFLSPRMLSMQISLSRWNHDLRVRCQDGSELPMSKQFSGGTVTAQLIDQAYFSSSFYFQATTSFRPDLDYWVVDHSTGEESPINTTDLREWIAAVPASEVTAVLQVDGTVKVDWTGAGGAYKFDVMRGVGGSWLKISSIAGEINDDDYTFVDPFPVPGATNQYKIVTRFDDRNSATSAIAQVVVRHIVGPLANIPLWEQDGDDGRFLSNVVFRSPRVPPGNLGVTRNPGGGVDAESRLDVSNRIPPKPADLQLRMHRFQSGSNQAGPIWDLDPSRVDIFFSGSDRQTGVVIERRVSTGSSWVSVGSPSSRTGMLTDTVEIGKIYYYRARGSNAAGQSMPGRMVRWIPPLYISAPLVGLWAQHNCRVPVEEEFRDDPFVDIYPGEDDDPPYDNVNSHYRADYEPASLGTVPSVDYPPKSRGESHLYRISFPAGMHGALWENSYPTITDSGHDYKEGWRAFLDVCTWRGSVINPPAQANLSYSVVQSDDMGISYRPISTTVAGAIVTLDPEQSTYRALSIKLSPSIRGRDSFSAFAEENIPGEVTSGSGSDYRRSVDFGSEIFIEKGGPPDQAQITLSDYPYGETVITATGNASRFRIKVRGQDVVTGMPFEDVFSADSVPVYDPWEGYIQSLVVEPKNDGTAAQPNDSITLKVRVNPQSDGVSPPIIPNPAADLSDEIKVTYIDDQTPASFEYASDEASGSRYRRVNLNGRPRPDAPPEGKTEDDFPLFGTYVDALTLQLRHEVTDVELPVPASTLGLGVSRRAEPFIWNTGRDLPPAQDLHSPFGVGWKSSLGMGVKIVATSGQETFAYITDYSGATQRFILGNASWALQPDGTYKAWAPDGNGGWTWQPDDMRRSVQQALDLLGLDKSSVTWVRDDLGSI